MTDDRTLHQTDEDQAAARNLSENRSGPPAEIPGYDLEYCIGSGAYGEVWAAVDRNTRRKVAVKFYTHRRGVDVGMLSREVEKLARLSSDRYVVQLLDVGWNATPPYYVMDYIENGSLEDLIRDNGGLPKQQALKIFEDVLVGLMHLHNKGILHCDLKPANVLLDEDLNPRLADFGQARMHSEEAGALGTLFYMAPEQADLSAVPDVRWDVYAAGVLLYCMLSGNPPHRDEAFLEKMQRIESVNDRLDAYRRHINRSDIKKNIRQLVRSDVALAEILEKALSASPSRRFQSAQDVLLAIKNRESNATRRPLLILGLATPLILMGIMLSFFWFMYQETKTETDAAILAKAGESNRWAAQLAARSASIQIDRYFRMVVELARDPSLKDDLKQILGNPTYAGAQDRLADPVRNRDEALDHDRELLRGLPASQRLHSLLIKRMVDPEYPTPSSLFICDPYGTQVATSFQGESAVNVLGRNYSYRSYFNGLNRDLQISDPEDQVELSTDNLASRSHITKTHFSAAFRSTANQHWKVAFTAPIWDEDELLGVIAATVDTGTFVEFNNGNNQYAMLVDGREGANRGTILEHPFFSQTVDAGQLLPDSVFQLRVPDEDLKREFGIFHDPIGSTDDGGLIGLEGLAQNYEGRWIAGTSPVLSDFGRISSNQQEKLATGLVVVAAENYRKVMEPANQLSQSLIRLATWTLLTLFSVFFGLAWFALRTVRQSSDRMIGIDLGSTEISGGSGRSNSQ